MIFSSGVWLLFDPEITKSVLSNITSSLLDTAYVTLLASSLCFSYVFLSLDIGVYYINAP